jgi:hypothetical protein
MPNAEYAEDVYVLKKYKDGDIKVIAKACSKTQAKRIANALNIYHPRKRHRKEKT